MAKQKLKVEVEVWNIQVNVASGKGNDQYGFYDFEYSIRKNRGVKRKGKMDGSWSSQSAANFRRVLRSGYASLMVIESRL
jgi:hypothetical protein